VRASATSPLWAVGQDNPNTFRRSHASNRSPLRSRTFNHRVKGTSMSTFSAEEIAKLQAGGNEVSVDSIPVGCRPLLSSARPRPGCARPLLAQFQRAAAGL